MSFGFRAPGAAGFAATRGGLGQLVWRGGTDDGRDRTRKDFSPLGDWFLSRGPRFILFWPFGGGAEGPPFPGFDNLSRLSFPFSSQGYQKRAWGAARAQGGV